MVDKPSKLTLARASNDNDPEAEARINAVVMDLEALSVPRVSRAGMTDHGKAWVSAEPPKKAEGRFQPLTPRSTGSPATDCRQPGCRAGRRG